MSLRRSFASLSICAALLAAASSHAQTSSKDPAARGLDLFLHLPDNAAPGATVPVQVEALGFPTVVSLVPLAGATVEAAWNPESLGPGISFAPPPVRATADASGRVHLDVPVPDGDERDLRLFVAVRIGGHERTREAKIHRGSFEKIDLHVADTRVVPGSTISSWVKVNSAATGEPLDKTRVELRLLEGGYARHRVELVTDAAGTAMTRVPIPRTDEPGWSWRLEARTLSPGKRTPAHSSLLLAPREETPGTPRMWASWDQSSVLAGDKANFTVRVRDASDQPIVDLPVRYWIGPKGTTPPDKDPQWLKVSTLVRTDASGSITGVADTPTTVMRGVGTTLRLVVKARVEGRDLDSTTTIDVGAPSATAALFPEANVIVPGMEQRMMLRMLDGHYRPISGRFMVEGDGLKAEVKTDDFGEAEILWRVPAEVGGLRNVGPCAGGVAAAVTVRALEELPALRTHSEPFELCVQIDRDATGMIALDRTVARVGEKVRVRVLESSDSARRGPKPGWSVMLHAGKGEQTASVWIEDGDKGAEIEVPSSAGGAVAISAAATSGGGKGSAEGDGSVSRMIHGSLLVTPKVLPSLGAKVTGGRLSPGGSVEIDADLSDGHGKGLRGTVAALVIDAFGGGSVRGILNLDTRHGLCSRFGVEKERCEGFLEGEPSLDPLRRAMLADAGPGALAPLFDPRATARTELIQAFGAVLLSLEGAVFEAATEPDRLRDVRRKSAGGWAFNPELMTLVTAAMSEPPLTPGGEKLSLGDLIAVDPQVSFNNVARRITRLKLFRILSAVRSFRLDKRLDADEPMFKNPNALLRRMVRDGILSEALLLDPWGGTIQFVPASGLPIPFLTAIRGFELRAPGPDGRVSTGDDVRDPFERVLRSGTPYAKAVSEDRIVDAKFDMEVGDATVSGWESMFDELTGTALGGMGGIGLGGIGSGGGGRGYGSGHGSGRLAGRRSLGMPTGVAYWSPPRRTDDKGHVHFTVPLGDTETTWRVAFVAVPDGGLPATTSVDVPVSLPLSARVEAGTKWVEGDRLAARVLLRNRTAKAIRASLSASASGVVRLAEAREGSKVVEVPAGGEATTLIALASSGAGHAALAVQVKAPGLPDDVLRHSWDVIEAGEPTDLTNAQWVAEGLGEAEQGVGRAILRVPFDAKGMRLHKKPRLVLERGYKEALRAALESLDPDRLFSPDALGDAIEVAGRVKRWALANEGEASSMAARAESLARRAKGRLEVVEENLRKGAWPTAMRVAAWAPADTIVRTPRKPDEVVCPPSDLLNVEWKLAALEAEPVPSAGAKTACWDALVSEILEDVQRGSDAVLLARAVLALSPHAHRSATAAVLVERLRSIAKLRSSGGITLSSWSAHDRASRALVYAALLRGVGLGKAGPASAETLGAWIGVQRDADGGYGSSEATRAVVAALLSSELEPRGMTRVAVNDGAGERVFEVGPSGRVEVPLDAKTTAVSLALRGPGLVARFERPVLRLWSKPPSEVSGPLHVDVSWPKDAKAGTTGVLRMQVRSDMGRAGMMDLRLPLPPGVALAERVSGVHQMQGVLLVRRSLDASGLPTLVEVPVRFGLPGKVMVPEAVAKVAFDELPRSLVPARLLVVR